jgi:hypothetical protein
VCKISSLVVQLYAALDRENVSKNLNVLGKIQVNPIPVVHLHVLYAALERENVAGRLGCSK